MPSDLIATIAKSHKIFIDTCSLYHDSADKVVFETLAPKLTAYENPIIVPFGVVKEIEKHVASGRCRQKTPGSISTRRK